MPMAPPAPRRMRLDSSARTRPIIFGINNTTMLNQNNAIINSTSNRGQVGNNWKSWLKYSGRMRRDCIASAKPMPSISSHRGDDK